MHSWTIDQLDNEALKWAAAFKENPKEILLMPRLPQCHPVRRGSSALRFRRDQETERCSSAIWLVEI